jgi:ubiquitin carboxyl-terminal hydrolase L3
MCADSSNIYQCWGLDKDCLAFVPSPVLAVIVTFEPIQKTKESQYGDPSVETTYFMKQTRKLDYACGVIACIHSVLNNSERVQLKEDSVLDLFLKATKNKTPEERAEFLEGNKEFQVAH